MTDLRKAVEMAVPLLIGYREYSGDHRIANRCGEVLEALRQALAQPEQEPVAWMMPEYGDVLSASEADGTGIYNIPLYTAPPKREWVGLTQEEVQEIAKQLIDDAAYCSTHFAIAIEAELRRKNNAV